MRSVEAGESAASHGVPAEDRWMEESGPAAADPGETGEGSGTGAAPGSSVAPCEVMEGSGSGAAPHETMEGGGSGAVPHEVSPLAPEQGAGSKRSRLDESGFLRMGHPLGLAPKKSLAIQAGQMVSPTVTPVSGRSGADVGAALANPTASVVAPTPAEVTEQAASSMADVVQPAEGRIPPVEAVMTAPSQDQPGTAVVAHEGVVQSAPPGA
ncbi:uncharacterized protein [Miscanthus floridulus]|uniref:uncharacterized protein n=1 Tax=Miscanthus floridulus TaxID=154761 RepID=UPI00345A1E17